MHIHQPNIEILNRKKYSNIKLIKRNNLHNFNIRSNDNISLPLVHTNCGKNSITYKGVKIYT